MPSFTRKLSSIVQDWDDPVFDLGLTELDYPIFDETYRPELNKKIIKHYWNYEIGQETESMFRFSLNRKMNEIMPYYNQLYLSTRIQFDPLQTMNYTDFASSTLTNTTESTSSATSDSDTNSKSRTVSSATPQVQLSPNEDYATAASDANSDSDVKSTSNADTNTTNSSHSSNERTLQGNSGLPAADLLMRYRATLLNIDMNVIRDLETLFMQLWDNGDEFSHSDGLGYGYDGFIGSFGIL